MSDVAVKDETRATAYHAVTAVWGREFIELFLDVCVPNQLSEGNLTALPPGSRYRVFTGSADHAALATTSRLNEVRRVLPVDVVEVDLAALDPQPNPNTYKMMTACHRRAVADAAAVEAALIFLSPDFILAKGTFEALLLRHRAGARAVMTANLRLSRESFLSDWAERARTQAAPAPRDLVALGMRHLHPSTQSCMVDAASTNDFPTAVYWPVRADGQLEGLMVRAFHLHPLLVDPVHRLELPRTTIDGHYVMMACPSPGQSVVVTDSDELVAFELTPASRVVGNHDRRYGVSLFRLLAVAAKCDAHQRSQWDHMIRLHASQPAGRWAAAEAQSAAFAQTLARYMPLSPVAAILSRSLKRWRRRRAGLARTVRWTLRNEARSLTRVVRRALRRRGGYARAASKAFQPKWAFKRIARSAKLVYHRAAKAVKLGLKRVRRRTGLFRAA